MPTQMHRRPTGRLLSLLAVLTALLLAAPALHAQAVTVTGRVVDASSRQPLAGVRLEIEDLNRRTITDAQGNFTLEGLQPGLYVMMVRHLGYAERREDLAVTDPATPLSISLTVDALVLEGINVQVDRFDRRRNATPMRVQTIRRREFENAVTQDTRKLLLERVGLTPCGGQDKDCVRIRGRNGRVQLIIDERPAVGGLGELESLDPSEIYMAESYGGGAQLRVYTVTFMERAARTRLIPEPIRI